MHKNKTFSHGKHHYTLCAFRGTVAEAQQNRTVHTEVSGGDGFIPAAQSGLPGRINSVRSSNTEYIHDRLFLVDAAANQETDIALTDWNFPARVGNDAAFCWLIRKGKQSGPIVYGANYSLNREIFADKSLPIFNPMRREALHKLFLLLAIPIALLCALLATDFYICIGHNGSGYTQRCFTHALNGFKHHSHNFLTFFLYAILGLIGGYIGVHVLYKILFAGAIRKGAAADQRLRDDIRQLCHEALAAPTSMTK